MLMLYPISLVPLSHNMFAQHCCCSRRIKPVVPLYTLRYLETIQSHKLSPNCNVLPILTSAFIKSHAPDAEDIPQYIIPSYIALSSVPVLLYSGIPAHTTTPILNLIINTVNKPHCDTLMGSSIDWICIDDVLGSIFLWTKYGNCGLITWETLHIFTSQSVSCIFQLLFPEENISIITSPDDIVTKIRSMNLNLSRFDCMFIPYKCGITTD